MCVRIGWAILVAALFFQAQPVSAASPIQLELHNEVVCYVNTDHISKKGIENRMLSEGGEVVMRLFMRRVKQKQDGTWDAKAQKEFDELYTPLFLDELKIAVKERLMFQESKELDLQIDQEEADKMLTNQLERMRQANVPRSQYRVKDLRKAIQEKMVIKQFRGQMINVLDLPNRPKVEAYYHDNIRRYQRKAGAKVRAIKINRFYRDQEGRLQVREDADKIAENLRSEIVDLDADFAATAQDHSDDDEAAKKRGGLLLGKDGSEFIVPEDTSRDLARAIAPLKPGDVSKVFRFGERSLAFLKLEKRRPAGPKPLTQKLYKEIYNILLDETVRRKEENWFKEAVKKSLILDSRRRPLPLRFFFPDEAQAPRQTRDVSQK